jgi:hypothetical protein
VGGTRSWSMTFLAKRNHILERKVIAFWRNLMDFQRKLKAFSVDNLAFVAETNGLAQ